MLEESVLLRLGRLDARLKVSPAHLPWQMAMRARGIVYASRNAGLLVDEEEICAWISSRSLPPRYKYGLNDPLRMPTVSEFYLRSLELVTDRANQEAARQLKSVFNIQRIAAEWAGEEVLEMQPIWSAARDKARTQCLSASFEQVAKACFLLLQVVGVADQRNLRLTNENLPIGIERVRPISWIASTMVPYLIWRSGLTEGLIPNIVPDLRHINLTITEIKMAIARRLQNEVEFAAKNLLDMERKLELISNNIITNRRSKIWPAALIMTAFPEMRRVRLSEALNIAPPGAGYLIKKLSSAN